MFELNGKVAVVVGGAGGLGQGFAQALSQQGARVVVASRNMEKLQKAAQEINAATGNEVTAVQVDATDEKSMEKLAEQVVAKYGTVDILVNAQGMNIKRAAVDVTVEDWDNIFATNVRSVMLSCRTFGKVMIEKKKGKIINVSSLRGARATDGGNEAYASTKGAVDMITRTLAIEWAPYGVNVNAVAPSLVMTETIKKALAPERIQMLLGQQPMGRFGVLDDMIGACVFLAAPESDFITGQILYVDGGLSAKG